MLLIELYYSINFGKSKLNRLYKRISKIKYCVESKFVQELLIIDNNNIFFSIIFFYSFINIYIFVREPNYFYYIF